MNSGIHSKGRPVESSLLDQMQITEFEIRQRKALFGLDRESEECLSSFFSSVKLRLDDIIERFYMTQLDNAEISLLIGDSGTLSRLQAGMRSYLLELFGGHYGLEYVNNRLRVGLVHKRIGVSPKLYLSAMASLEGLLVTTVSEMLSLTDTPSRPARESIRKILSFDVSYVMDTYIRSLMSEVESNRKVLVDYAESLEEQVRNRTRELEDASRTDGLTKVYNQRAFYDHLKVMLAKAARSSEPLCLIYMDADGFKLVNDRQGHQAGDALLVNIANSISSSIRDMDVACRYGGDEFCIILPGTTAPQAEVVCRRIQTTFAQVTIDVTLSMGIVQAGPEKFVNMDQLVQMADGAMYKAKGIAPASIRSVVVDEVLPQAREAEIPSETATILPIAAARGDLDWKSGT